MPSDRAPAVAAAIATARIFVVKTPGPSTEPATAGPPPSEPPEPPPYREPAESPPDTSVVAS
jgi:hypothetical protein